MTSRFAFAATTAVLASVLTVAPRDGAAGNQPPQTSRAPRNAAEFDALFEEPGEETPVAALTPGPESPPPGAPAGEPEREKSKKAKGPATAPTPAKSHAQVTIR